MLASLTCTFIFVGYVIDVTAVNQIDLDSHNAGYQPTTLGALLIHEYKRKYYRL